LTQPWRNLGRVGLLALAGAALTLSPRNAAAQRRAANAATASMIKYLTKLATAPSTDVEPSAVRQRYGLPKVTNASSIAVVTRAATCTSALQKYNATAPQSPVPTSIYVVSVGNAYVVWNAPAPPGSEFQLHMVMTSKFVVLSKFAG